MSSVSSSRSPVPVLAICFTYPPILGGSEVELQRVCAALRGRGYQITVLCAGFDGMPDAPRWLDPEGTPVRTFGRHWPARWKPHAFALGVAWTLWSFRKHYRAAYFLMPGLHLATGLPVARLVSKPVAMKFSGSSIIASMRDSWLGRLELACLRRWAGSIMILNPGMEQEAVAAGFPPRTLSWMPNPIDVDRFAPAPAEERARLRQDLGIPLDAPVTVYVGRLAPEKEIPSLLAAYARLVRQMPSAHLFLVGDGPDHAALQARSRELGLERNVHFSGRCPPDGVRAWLKASDVFALVSSNEGFSCSLAEAMSSALPSVVSDIPANTQLIGDQVHGLIAPLGDDAALAGALLRLLGDAGLRQRLGAAARRRVIDNYSIDMVIDRYERLFSQLIEPSEPAAPPATQSAGSMDPDS